MSKLSYKQHRLIAAVLLAVGLVGVGNYYLELGLFGRFGKQIFLLSVALLIGYGFLFMPSRETMEQQRKKQKEEKQQQ